MKHKILFITCILFFIFNGPLLAQGIPEDAPPEDVLRAVLHLSEEQVNEIIGLVDARAEAIQAIAEQIHLLQGHLEEVVHHDAHETGFAFL